VANKDAGVKSPADLKGKKVGVPDIGSLLDVTFRRYLIKHGVRPSDVTMIEAAFRQMGDLLRGGQLDAVLVIEPFRSRLLGDGTGVQVANFLDEILKNQTMAFWIAERKWARQNGPVLAKFKEAVQDGVAVLKTDEAQAREAAKKYFGVDAKDLPSYEVSVPVQDFKFYQELGKEIGLLKGSSDPAKLILP
jgi:NitT/TauT family transport system substrate-binding protein